MIKHVLTVVLFTFSAPAEADNPAYGSVQVVERCHEISDLFTSFYLVSMSFDAGQASSAMRIIQESSSFGADVSFLARVAGPELSMFIEDNESELGDLERSAKQCLLAFNDRSNGCVSEVIFEQVVSLTRDLLDACEADYRNKE